MSGTSDFTERTAFLGLGVMGFPMAANLAKAGIPLVTFDVSEAQRAAARDAGIPVAESLAAAVTGATVIITMVPDTPHVEQIAADLFAGSLPAAGSLVIDMSTISPQVTRNLAERYAAVGADFLDAPVSGGVRGARLGELSIMAGGREAAFQRALPLFGVLGKAATYMGGAGAGQATKLCNQVATAVNIQAVCEAFALGRQLGLNLPKLAAALGGGAAGSWVLENLGPQMLAGDDSAGFRISLQAKDLRLALDAAQAAHASLPAAAGVTMLYQEALAHGEGDHGNQALFRVYERLSDISFSGADR
jgi:2-hydroxy-3-oxopropionate reductase